MGREYGGKWKDDDSEQDVGDGCGGFPGVVCGDWGRLPLGQVGAHLQLERLVIEILRQGFITALRIRKLKTIWTARI